MGLRPPLLSYAPIQKGGEKMVTAKLVYPNNGYHSDVEKVKGSGMVVGNEYPVDMISMGQSHTSVYLSGFRGAFNSVHFEFLEDGCPLDIFRDSRFNPYIGGGRRGG